MDINLIDTNKNQPRKHFIGLEELAESIKENGVMQPITVRPTGDRYEIIIGERRFRAAIMAGLMEIPAQVREVGPAESYRLAVVENIQRQDLTPLEEAKALQELQAQGMTQEEIAATIGKGQSYISHKLKLLKLPPFLKVFIETDTLTENHIRQLVKLKNIYPPDLMRPFGEELTGDYPKNEKQAALFILGIRPEARALMIKASPVQMEACRLLSDYVLKHNYQVLQWQVAALWWACAASGLPLTVVELAEGIKNWKSRYYDAAAMMQLYQERQEKDRGGDYWGYWADLRHSATLPLVLNPDNQAREWLANTIDHVLLNNSYTLPSNVH